MPAVSTQISQKEPVNRPVEMLRIEMRVEDGESQWKSEREERKEETSGESETVRLAIINHIRCWRRLRILATRQTLRLSSIPFLSSSNSLVTLITHTALGHAPKTHDRVRFVLAANWPIYNGLVFMLIRRNSSWPQNSEQPRLHRHTADSGPTHNDAQSLTLSVVFATY